MTDKEYIKLLWDKLDSFGMVCKEELRGDGKWHLHTCDAGFINGERQPCEEDCAEIADILKRTTNS